MKKQQKDLPPKENTITYGLKGFNINRFQLTEPGLDITSNFKIDNMKLGINMDFSPIAEVSEFHIGLTIIIQYDLNGNNIPLLELIFIGIYEIKNLKTIIKLSNQKFSIPDDLLTTLVSITYSSARGIIYEKTKGSYLNQFLLPIMDPRTIIENNTKNRTI